MQEYNLTDYAALTAKTEAAVDRFHKLRGAKVHRGGSLQSVALMGTVVDYAKTRPVFDGYKAARYGKKCLAEHRADIDTHRAAQATFTRLLNGGKLPKLDALKNEHGKLAAEKKTAYKEHRQMKQEMREAMTAKANIDHLLSITGGAKTRKWSDSDMTQQQGAKRPLRVNMTRSVGFGEGTPQQADFWYFRRKAKYQKYATVARLPCLHLAASP